MSKLVEVPVSDCVLLKRNPQYLTEVQMQALKDSISRDGFVSPILVRPLKDSRYEIISGNHRFLAAKEVGLKKIPAVVATLTKAQAQRLAVNLNTVHGDPNAELLAPFLAELPDDVLRSVHLSDDLLADLVKFDALLAQRLSELEPPDALDNDSPTTEINQCRCPLCGKPHIRQSEKAKEAERKQRAP